MISKNSFGQNSQQTEQLKTVEAITHRQQKRSIVPVPINGGAAPSCAHCCKRLPTSTCHDCPERWQNCLVSGKKEPSIDWGEYTTLFWMSTLSPRPVNTLPNRRQSMRRRRKSANRLSMGWLPDSRENKTHTRGLCCLLLYTRLFINIYLKAIKITIWKEDKTVYKPNRFSLSFFQQINTAEMQPRCQKHKTRYLLRLHFYPSNLVITNSTAP